MKLLSFNIQNYRSIIHSDWCKLAHDNITALIGQNESGKTSVLEAIYSFYNGIIYDDILRSDMSLPIVSCEFELDGNTLLDVIDEDLLANELVPLFKKCSRFILTRKWNTDKSSKLFLANTAVLEYFAKKEKEQFTKFKKTKEDIDSLLIKSMETFQLMDSAEKELLEAQNDFKEIRKHLNICNKQLRKARKPELKVSAESNFNRAQKEYANAEELYNKKLELFNTTKNKIEEISEKVSVCKTCNEAAEELTNIGISIRKLKTSVKNTERQFEIASTEKEQKSAYSQLLQLNTELDNLYQKLNEATENEIRYKLIARKVLKGKTYDSALEEALDEIERENRMYNKYSLGKLFFEKLPKFEFFEDFSSLLPNKIDLEDIINENTHVEGYKAARNFLEIAGLNEEFFSESNHRILKQKIENLNGEITINFQDYWSQNVGNNDKIQLNFELEHYDYTHPEKSGKPYLEFWIKDKAERLYPKQRSRGVRWFLSFYLELKATAKSTKATRILLIDEPGLSLHAKAQEDVLRVFEDIKENMQIIYCTHSPHLINANKLYRILAIQRANEKDEGSETIMLNANSFYDASSDTLSPIFSLMGMRVNNQDFIKPQNNIIVEDTIAFYYFKAFCRFAEIRNFPSFIPSTGLTNIPDMVNILLGWKVGFSVLLFGKKRSAEMENLLLESVFYIKNSQDKDKIIKIEEFEFPEDVFSTLDFKKFVLQKREGITEKNSEYIEVNKLSRTILASQFINYCESNNVKMSNFDEITQQNIIIFVQSLKTV